MSFKFENLEVWKLARKFASDVYKLTRQFPGDELFGLISQTRRAAVSVALNIAEGCNRRSDPYFRRFLNMARSSLDEVVTALFIALDQGFISEDELKSLYIKSNNLAAKITALTNKLK